MDTFFTLLELKTGFTSVLNRINVLELSNQNRPKCQDQDCWLIRLFGLHVSFLHKSHQLFLLSSSCDSTLPRRVSAHAIGAGDQLTPARPLLMKIEADKLRRGDVGGIDGGGARLASLPVRRDGSPWGADRPICLVCIEMQRPPQPVARCSLEALQGEPKQSRFGRGVGGWLLWANASRLPSEAHRDER